MRHPRAPAGGAARVEAGWPKPLCLGLGTVAAHRAALQRDYAVDFYCPECRLAIEFDGEKHSNSMASEYDLRCTEFLRRHNIRVLRFENRAVFEHPDGVLQAIKSHLTTPSPS